MAHKEQLLAAMRAVRSELDSFIREHRDQPAAAIGGGWSLHDTIAHVALWDRMAARKFSGTPLPEGEDLALASDSDLVATSGDTLNDAMRARWRDRPLDEVLADYAAAHLVIVAAVERARDEDCAPGGRVWRVIAEDNAGHYPHHFPVRDRFTEQPAAPPSGQER